MEPIITSPEKFAARFNALVPGAYRRITVQDIRDMTECGLIGQHRWYNRSDLETVRRVLRYEELREKRIEKYEAKAISDVPRCKMCGEPLSHQPEGKKGRPKEYCASCEPSRVRLRHKKWRRKRQAVPC